MDPREKPSQDDDFDEALDRAADAMQHDHDDAQEREQRQEAAEEAGHSPRREGEGIHPGSH